MPVAALIAALVIDACADDQRPTAATAAATSPTAVPYTATAQAGFPTDTSTGVPADTKLVVWSGALRTSEVEDQPIEVRNGLSCQVFEGVDFQLADTGNFVEVDSPCVIFRYSRVTTDGYVSNTSAMIQQAAENRLLVVEGSDFDGGPHHQRGIQADYSTVEVTGSRFVRFGNAGVEMNNREVDADLTVEASYFQETGGWDRDDHVDGIQVGGARAVTIRDNTVLIQAFGAGDGDESYVSNSALGIWAEAGDVAGPVTIEHNLLGGGGQVIYLESKDGFTFRGTVTVADNSFDRRYSYLGGIWGVLAQNNLPDDLRWNDNTWEDGAPLSLASVEHPGDILPPDTSS